MPWRYQPVWTDHRGERMYSLVEVHFEKGSDALVRWTANCAMTPYGDDQQELCGCLAMMLADAYKWKAVPFLEMRPGMTFERAISQDKADQIADMIDAMAEASDIASKELN